jgi:site-specific DNA recombinase
MKVAYQYIRISEEDQSNFSLSGQEKMNRDYAAKHGIDVVKTFIDDGCSAKNFNRPQWKLLEKELAKNKTKIDYLVVTKYDRLIRNAAEGLAFIEKLEQKWDIKLLSVMENFFIDPHSPFFFKTRADLLVTAEFERRVISDRSKFGVWSAKSQGRFIGVAPVGYDNARDDQDKPIIIVNNNEKPVVEQIYDDFLRDVPFTSIRERAATRGFKLKGHDALTRILTNHTYAGLILTPNYKDETSKVVKGIHEAIIPEEKFWKAYYKLLDKIRPQGPKTIDTNIPLRGWMLCQSCGGLHTGGKSKGRSNYYYYYRCKKCLGENYAANEVHMEMKIILNCLSLDDRDVKPLIIEAGIRLEQALKDKHGLLKKVQSDYERLNEKLSSLEEKYISNSISQATYEKWYPAYSKEVQQKGAELTELQKDEGETLDLYNHAMPHLTDLDRIYGIADVGYKQRFLNGIFLGGFTKEKQGGRTGFLNPMFHPNSSKIGHLLRVHEMKKPDFSSGFPTCTPGGS